MSMEEKPGKLRQRAVQGELVELRTSCWDEFVRIDSISSEFILGLGSTLHGITFISELHFSGRPDLSSYM